MTDSFVVTPDIDPQGHEVIYGLTIDDDTHETINLFPISPEGEDSRLQHLITLRNGSSIVEFDTSIENGFHGNSYKTVAEYSSSGKLLDETEIGGNNIFGQKASFDPTVLNGGGAYVALIQTLDGRFGDAVSTASLRFSDGTAHAKTIDLFTEISPSGPFLSLFHSHPTVQALADGGFTVGYSATYVGGTTETGEPIPVPGGSESYRATYDAAANLVTSVFVDFGHKTDLVTSSVSTVLSPSFYNLTLIGAAAIDGRGNALANTIIGNDARNHLVGGGGDDRIDGGLGSDYLEGGAGKDVFVFDTALSPKWNSDTIGDFRHGFDKIELSSTIFSALAAGKLSASAFSDVGSGHAHASGLIIYDASGDLSYDADGAGTAAAPIKFATLNGHPFLTSSDFVVA